MTRRELIEQIERHRKRATRWSILWLVSFFALFGLGAIFAEDIPPAMETILGVVLVVLMLASVLALIFGGLRSMRRSGLVCPHCHALLTKDLWPVAIASGRCGRCGEQIADDEDCTRTHE